MLWVDRFERRYVDFYRVAIAILLLLALLAILGSVLFYVSSVLSDREHLPPLGEQVEESKAPPPSEAEDTKPARERGPIDPRIERIHKALARQFERNPGGVEQFEALVSKRILQEQIFERCSMPGDWKDRCLQDLERFAVSLGADERINRVGSIEMRARLLLQGIDLWFIRYKANVAEARAQAEALNLAEEARTAAALTTMMGVAAAGAGIIISIILLVVMIRIEVHLRSISGTLARQAEPKRDADPS
jgi:hypothetical protein